MRLTPRSIQAFIIVLASVAAVRSNEPAVDLAGTWKLVVLAFGEDEFAVVKLELPGGKPSATVLGAQPMIVGNASESKIDPITIDGDSLSFVFKSPAGASQFRGRLATSGPEAGRILGTFTFRDELHPARLERTGSNKVAELKASPLSQEYVSALQEGDIHTRIKMLRQSIKKYAGTATSYRFYTELLKAAEAGGLAPEEVGELVQKWIQEATPYGEAWVKEVHQKALKALGAAKPYAGLAVKLAEQADKELDEDSELEQKAAVVASLAQAAKLAGKADLAALAEARSAKLEQRVDEEYHRKVPPFQPEKFSGRKNARANRVVLMELFTGAQCPPCVAADVAFDALVRTYQPTEFIGLQYHLHIPGPDPLTNEDTVARVKYYESEFQGTPSTFFNGRSEAGGGGGMQASQSKYKEFREIIDRELQSSRGAEIDLSATRAGNQIEIKAKASVTPKPQSHEAEKEKELAGRPESKRTDAPSKLRLVLIEEAVRYVGNNHLRFHHNVVRGFPGGVEGKALSSGSGEVTITLNLAELKKGIEGYLSDRAKARPFPGTLPDVALNHLSVVAFVQDDSDKNVLGAVSVPLKVANP